MSRLSTTISWLARHCAQRQVAVAVAVRPRVPPIPAVFCPRLSAVPPARLRSTSSKVTPEPVEEPTEESQGAADLFDEVELDGEEWEGEEIEEGVFVSLPTPATPSPNSTLPSRPKRPQTTSIKHLNRLLSRHQVPDIPEHELDEKFVRGRGPGGQAINKTNSSVSLRHIPTGIRIQSQPTRSREQNRIIARQILKERLDLMRVRGEYPSMDPPPGPAAKGRGDDEEEPKEMTRKERLAAEARQWSKQELRWEKERRRKANRAKKVKRRNKDEAVGADSGGDK